MTTPELRWDFGTAYDLFVSLVVLHDPEKFGLRASWAAGVRSRLPAEDRKILEEIYPFIWLPMDWLYRLPAPKDAASALWTLRQLPAEERLPALMLSYEGATEYPELVKLFQRVAERRAWEPQDLETLNSFYRAKKDHAFHTPKDLSTLLNWWARPDEFGERYLSALQSYQQVFFAEEEKRITPALKEGLERAQELAARLPVPELIEELSQGVHFDERFYTAEIILVPTFWSTPIVMFSKLSRDSTMLLFGARPADASLVPGESVPDALLQALKAMADPTRLKILRYLSQEPLTPSELSRRLRLRAPTVTHHLSALRLAGLVHISHASGSEKQYTARMEGIQSTVKNLREFLENSSGEEEA